MSAVRQVVIGVLASLALPAMAAFELDALMADLAQRAGGRATFVETRYLAVLEKPIVVTGELAYTAPDRLEKRTHSPKAEVMVVEGEHLTIERDQKKLFIDLAYHPQTRAVIDSIRGTLTGNRHALEKSYLLHLSGSTESWELVLLPRDESIAAVVQRINVAGRVGRIHRIELWETDGDRSVMAIEQIEAR